MKTYRLDKESLPRVLAEIASKPLDGTMQIDIRMYKKDRSLAQNRLTHHHYRQIALQTGHNAGYIKAECKLVYAAPILIAENEEFAAKWTAVQPGLDYEQQIKLAGMVDMTSIMNLAQMSNYIEEYMNVYQANGIHLSHPEDLYFEAMG